MLLKRKYIEIIIIISLRRGLWPGRRLLFVFVFVPATAAVSCSLVPRTAAAARRATGSMSRGRRACARAFRRRRLRRGGIGSLRGHRRRRAREKRDAQLRPQVALGGNSRGSTVIDTLRVDRIMF